MIQALGMGAAAVAMFFLAILGALGLWGGFITASERNWRQFSFAIATAVISLWLAASCGFYLDGLTK